MMSESSATPVSQRDTLAVTIARFKRTVRLGVKSLWLHRLRSLLTALGIVFGVASVIAMLAIGEGASYEAQETIRRLGSNNIIVRSIKPPQDDDASGKSSFVIDYGITYADVREIRATVPGVTVVVPGRIIRRDVSNLARRADCDIVGTVPWYPEMRNHAVAFGRFFTDAEMGAHANVCVIDEALARNLFPIDSPIGRDVGIGTAYYRVIGIMSHDSTVPAGGDETEDTASLGGSAATQAAAYRMFIPLTSAKSRFGEVLIKRTSGSIEAEKVELHELTVKVHEQDNVVEASLLIGDILNDNHNKEDYGITVPLELLRQAERTKRIFNIVLGSIAAISLLVGGIGIMNIMLASVTERTREIGIRRALGAKRRDIISQFLIETVLLSASGGVIGVVVGIAIPLLVTHFANMVTVVTPWSPAIAFSISAMVGIVFGIYPAIRAADMDPVEALRHE